MIYLSILVAVVIVAVLLQRIGKSKVDQNSTVLKNRQVFLVFPFTYNLLNSIKAF